MTAARRRPLLAAVILVLALVALAGAPASAGPPPQAGSLATSASETTWSQYVTLTATTTVPRGTPKPTGEVVFADDAGEIGTVALANGVARLRTKTLAVGTHPITATHDGAPIGDPVLVTVAPATTTTTLVSKKTEVLSGTAWFQATVAPVAPATTVPTGWVEFTVDGAAEPAGSAPVTGGIASWRPRLADGLHTVTATFEATGNHEASTSDAVAQRIGTDPTGPGGDGESTLDQWNEVDGSTARPFPDRSFAQTFTAGITGLLDEVEYRVRFEDHATIAVALHEVDELGHPTGPALWSRATRDVDAGGQVVALDTPVPVQAGQRYSLVLTVTGYATLVASSDPFPGAVAFERPAQTWNASAYTLGFATWVRPAPTVQSTLAVSADETVWSEYVNVTATLTPSAGAAAPTGTVRFYADQVEIGSAPLTRGVARLRTKALPVGSPLITARYAGDQTYAADHVQGWATIAVQPAATTTTLVSKKTEVLSGTAWFQARVAPVGPATATPTGTVELFLDGDPIPVADVPLVGGVASWRPRLADGPHTVTAAYVGSDQAQTSTSAEVVQHVGTPPPAGTLDQSNGPGTGFVQAQPGYSVGQTFTVGRTGVLDRVTIDFEVAGRCAFVAIWSYDFDQPMGNTGMTTVLTTEEGPTTIDLLSPVDVVAGQTYVIVLDSCEGDGSPVEVATTEDTYAGGTGLLYEPGMNWWTPWDPWTRPDLVFETWVRPAPTP